MNTHPKSSYIKGEETLLHYVYRAPKTPSNKPAPLVLLLHGVGSNEHDLFSFANQLPDHFLVVSARAPYELGADSYGWYEVDFSSGKPVINKEKAEKSRTILIQFLSQLKEKFQIDEQQVYLCGFSQGAIMAYSVGLTRPDKVKGIAVMSGRLLDETKYLVKSGPALQRLRVLITHGAYDNVLGIYYAKESIAYLKELGLQPEFKEYPEGHRISAAMVTDISYWLGQP